MTKALFFDIDGTLVSFQTHTIPASTIEALTLAHQKGIQIFIATGRPTLIINNLYELQSRGLIDGYITMNGGYCYVGDKIVYKSTIPENDVQTIAHFCKANHFPCIFVGEHDASVCHPDDMLRYIFYTHLGVEEFPEEDFEKAIQRDVYQITPFFNSEQEKELLKQVENCEFGRWHPAFVDITAKGNTKQNGIDKFMERFGFKLEETMAFGDGGNDIGMLRHAGIGVAMGNASEEVKNAANFVTRSVDNDGIYHALKYFNVI